MKTSVALLALIMVLIFSATVFAQQPRWVRAGHIGGIQTLNFMPDGKHFISTGFSGDRILVWNSSTGSFERSILLPRVLQYAYQDSKYYQNMTALAVAPSGSTIAVGFDSIIYFLDFSSGAIIDSITQLPYTPSLLQFSESGDTLAWINDEPYNSIVVRYNLSNHALIDTFQLPGSYQVRNGGFNNGVSICISQDCKTVAYIWGGIIVSRLGITNSSDTLIPKGYLESIALNADGTELAFSSDSSEILDVNSGSIIYAWKFSGLAPVFYFLGNSDTIFYLADSGIELHTPQSPTDTEIKLTKTSTAGPGWASSFTSPFCDFSPDRSLIITSGNELNLGGGPVAGVISMYRSPNYIEQEATGNCGSVTQIRWSPTLDTITASDNGGGIRSFNALTGSTTEEYGPRGERIGGFDYFPDGDSLAASVFNDDDLECGSCDYINTFSSDSLAVIGDIVNINTLGSSLFFPGIFLSPATQKVAFGNYVEPFGTFFYDVPNQSGPLNLVYDIDRSGQILLGQSSDGFSAASITGGSAAPLPDPNPSSVTNASFSPDGKEIAVAQTDKSVEVLSYPSCTQIYQLQGHKAPVTAAYFSSNGRYLVSSSLDSTMIVWDLSNGDSIFTYRYPSPLYTAGFSHDDGFVAATDDGAMVLVWDAPASLAVSQQNIPSRSLSISSIPNPASSEYTVSFTVPETESAILELYDVLGNPILDLPQGILSAGVHSITLSTESIVNGIYFYRLTTPAGSASGRMVVSK